MTLIRRIAWTLSAFHLLFYPLQAASHGIAMLGPLKYEKDFTHFEGLNPDAPQGGTLKLAVVGTFDSNNPFINKGIPPAGISLYSDKLIFEPLMKRAPDEAMSFYGLIAESVDVAPDRSWVLFKLRPNARWSDGKAITADDVLFSHQIVRDKGRFNLRSLYARVEKAEKIDPLTVKFTFTREADGSFDPELPCVMAMMNILPKHIIETQDFEKNIFDTLIGSGPYRVKEMHYGKYIIFEKRKDYWGKDLPVNKGLYNVDTIRYDYYLDSKVAFEAFKSGLYDVRIEPDIALWHKGYNFQAVHQKKIVREEIPHTMPVGMKAYVMNTRKPYLSDPRVRQALILAFDFEWINKNLLFNAYTRTKSFFDNTELASRDLPSGIEYDILKKFEKQLDPKIFNEPYVVPVSDGHGTNRENLKKAKTLLQEAGWIIKNNTLIHKDTKKPYEIELLLYSKDDQKVALSYARSLKKLGIKLNVRIVDTAQFENRRMKFDYDLFLQTWAHSLSPGNEQKLYWASYNAEEEGSRNYAGAKDPVIDALAAMITTAKSREEMVSIVRALDRVLLFHDFVVPLAHQNKYYVSYWNRVAHPKSGQSGQMMTMSAWWANQNN